MQLLDVQQASSYLSVSVSTIRSWVSQRKIPFIKLHRRVLFDPADLAKFLDTLKVAPKK